MKSVLGGGAVAASPRCSVWANSLSSQSPSASASSPGGSDDACAASIAASNCCGVVPAASRNYVPVGLAAAMLAALLVALTQRGIVRAETGGDPRMASAALQSYLGLAFVAKLLVLGLGVGGLSLAGLKFASLATFALTFVGAALICQLTAAGYLSRALGRASRVTKHQP